MAAITTAQSGVGAALLERSDRPGGRLGLQVQALQGPKSIYKGRNGVEFCRDLIDELDSAGGHLRLNADVLAIDPSSRDSDSFLLTCASGGSTATVEATYVVLAAGSKEPAGDFPGAALDGVMLSNDVQRMVNVEGTLPGRRVLVVGSDNAGLLIAADLMQTGAEVVAVVEAASAVVGREANAKPLLAAGVEILTSTRVMTAHGPGHVDSVVLLGPDGRERKLEVDGRVPGSTARAFLGAGVAGRLHHARRRSPGRRGCHPRPLHGYRRPRTSPVRRYGRRRERSCRTGERSPGRAIRGDAAGVRSSRSHRPGTVGSRPARLPEAGPQGSHATRG